MRRIFVALGSNIDALQNLREAVTLLRAHWPFLATSAIYDTAPRERADQPDFLNAAVSFESDESLPDAHAKLLEIERKLKKSPPFRFGPRTIDLDIALVDDLILPDKLRWMADRVRPVEEQREQLYVPHLRLDQRRFVLDPLCDILDPRTPHPVLGTTFEALLEAVSDQPCVRTTYTF